MDVSQYKDLYLSEAKKYIAVIEQGFLALRKSPEDAEPLDSMARAAHSLKGMSAQMGYERPAKLAGRLESLFDAVRQGTAPVPTELVTLIPDWLAAFRIVLQEAVDGRAGDADLTGLLGHMEALSTGNAG